MLLLLLLFYFIYFFFFTVTSIEQSPKNQPGNVLFTLQGEFHDDYKETYTHSEKSKSCKNLKLSSACNSRNILISLIICKVIWAIDSKPIQAFRPIQVLPSSLCMTERKAGQDNTVSSLHPTFPRKDTSLINETIHNFLYFKLVLQLKNLNC